MPLISRVGNALTSPLTIWGEGGEVLVILTKYHVCRCCWTTRAGACCAPSLLWQVPATVSCYAYCLQSWNSGAWVQWSRPLHRTTRRNTSSCPMCSLDWCSRSVLLTRLVQQVSAPHQTGAAGQCSSPDWCSRSVPSSTYRISLMFQPALPSLENELIMLALPMQYGNNKLSAF